MKTFVVVTPTYNRAKFLPRLYDSLLQQTFQFDKFDWLIVDDGSQDDTYNVVECFKEVSPFRIIYLKKTNGGKHSAWKYAVDYLTVNSQYVYFVSIDSDDVLTPDALSTFYENWIEIESNNNGVDILNARTISYGEMDNPHPIYGDELFIEGTYQDIAIKEGEQSEMITSFRVKDLNMYLAIPDKFWLSDKVRFYAEYIIWARNGKRTKTRWLKKYLRVMYHDSGNQVSNNAKIKSFNHLYNYIVGYKYYLSENIDDLLKYQKTKLLVDLVKYGVMCLLVDIPIEESYRQLSSRLLKLLYILMFPIMICGVIAFHIRRFIR